MILTGSQAAILRGCFPDWRGDQAPNDVDLVGTREEFWSLVRYLKNQYRIVVPVDRGGGWMAVRVFLEGGERILVDYATTDIPSSLLLENLTDNLPGKILGQEVQVISCLTQYVIKRAYSHVDVHRDKNDADLAYWENLVGEQQWSSAHQALHDQLRAEYDATT